MQSISVGIAAMMLAEYCWPSHRAVCTRGGNGRPNDPPEAFLQPNAQCV